VRINKICVIGLGYIGLPTACTFANAGVKVAGIDVNLKIVDQLTRGQLHIHEEGLLPMLQKSIATGNLVFSDQVQEADAFIITVPTPFYDDKKADMRFVKSAAESIVTVLKKDNLVVLESTSPPRTTVDILQPILEKSGLKAGRDFQLAYSPERVLPGQILRELVENARVVGGIDEKSAQAGKALYQTFVKGEIITTNSTTAELVKLMENTYRDINIAIANEFAKLADRFGVDIWEVVQIANLHPRVKILKPGTGVGGHCIGVDPWFLVEAASDLTTLIKTARLVNDAQPEYVVGLIKRILGALEVKKISLLGLAYKPDVDDLRESPAIEIARQLVESGARVSAYEPYKPGFKMEGVMMANTLEGVIHDADMIVLLVNHKVFQNLDPNEITRITRCHNFLDAVGGWDPLVWRASGLCLHRLGVSGKD